MRETGITETLWTMAVLIGIILICVTIGVTRKPLPASTPAMIAEATKGGQNCAKDYATIMIGVHRCSKACAEVYGRTQAGAACEASAKKEYYVGRLD